MIGYHEWRKEKDFWQRSETFAADMRQREREEWAEKLRNESRKSITEANSKEPPHDPDR